MSVILQIGNSLTEIIGVVPMEAEKEIAKMLSYVEKSDGYRRHKFKERFGYYPPEKRFYLLNHNKFPTGMTINVIEYFKRIGLEFKIIDNRIKPAPYIDANWTCEYNLDSYQVEAVEALKKAGRGRLDAATGSGKGVIYMKLIHELGVRALIVCSTREALYDMYLEAQNCFDRGYGRIGDGYKTHGEALTCITKASFCKLPKETLNQYDCLIIDEHHGAAGKELYKQILAMDCYYKFGGSGSQYRNDGKDILLQATTGRVLYSIKTKDLQKRGRLTESKITFIEPDIKTIGSKQFSDFHEQYKYCVVNNDERNFIARKIIKKHMGQQTLILCKSIEHGGILVDLLKDLVPNVIWLDGSTKKKVREQVKEEFKRGERSVIISSVIFDESVNLPNLQVVLVLSAGTSLTKTVQRLGRALRKFEGKDKSYVYYMYDSFNDKLLKQSVEIFKHLKKEGHEITITKEADL